MSFPHSDFENFEVNAAAKRAVDIHEKEEVLLTPDDKEMREHEHTGIELTAAELAYLQALTLKTMDRNRERIHTLENQLKTNAAPNAHNAEAELVSLKKELSFLEHNLAEKLFEKSTESGH